MEAIKKRNIYYWSRLKGSQLFLFISTCTVLHVPHSGIACEWAVKGKAVYLSLEHKSGDDLYNLKDNPVKIILMKHFIYSSVLDSHILTAETCCSWRNTTSLAAICPVEDQFMTQLISRVVVHKLAWKVL